jgi:hypothetical protein
MITVTVHPTPVTNLVNPLSTTVYTVTGAYTLNLCSATNTVQIDVFTPTLSISKVIHKDYLFFGTGQHLMMIPGGLAC